MHDTLIRTARASLDSARCDTDASERARAAGDLAVAATLARAAADLADEAATLLRAHADKLGDGRMAPLATESGRIEWVYDLSDIIDEAMSV